MNLIDIITEVNVENTLKIGGCSELVYSRHCHWDCCVYTDSYCLLLPGEYEAALEKGFNFDGYDIVDNNYYGGMKITPTSKTCCVGVDAPEMSYKSLDCWFYPYWPTVEDGTLKLIAGNLCPLRNFKDEDVESHKEKVREYGMMLIRNEKILNFLSNAKMIGYSSEDEW